MNNKPLLIVLGIVGFGLVFIYAGYKSAEIGTTGVKVSAGCSFMDYLRGRCS